MDGNFHEFGLMLFIYIMFVGSDGSIGRPGMTLATPQVTKKIKKKKKVLENNYWPLALPKKN
jgi:hypothetical protein